MDMPWTPARVAVDGANSLDEDEFSLGYADEAAALAGDALRRELRKRDVYVGQGQRALTNKFDPEAWRFLIYSAIDFFSRHYALLGWWRSPYAGSQLWLMSNGRADVSILAPELFASRDVFSRPVAEHYDAPGMAEAYVAARQQFIAAASTMRGYELFVNDAKRIDVKR